MRQRIRPRFYWLEALAYLLLFHKTHAPPPPPHLSFTSPTRLSHLFSSLKWLQERCRVRFLHLENMIASLIRLVGIPISSPWLNDKIQRYYQERDSAKEITTCTLV